MNEYSIDISYLYDYMLKRDKNNETANNKREEGKRDRIKIMKSSFPKCYKLQEIIIIREG